MCPKIQMGGGKNDCGQGSKGGGIKFWNFFRGGKFFSTTCPQLLLMYDVKSNIERVKVQNLPFIAIEWALNWTFGQNSAFGKFKKIIKIKFRASKCVKMAVFGPFKSQKSISRKM